MMLERTLLCLLGLSALPAAPVLAEDAVEAMDRGDRLAADGELEPALAAYAEAYGDRRHGAAAAYNAGTLALQLGRLPDAVLWLRRAQAAASGPDAWTAENLAAARRLLGTAGASGPWEYAALAGRCLTWGAVGLAWCALGLALAARRTRRRHGALAALGVAALLFGAGAGWARWGPREAVLLEACPGLSLPPGSEVWVLPGAVRTRVLGPGGGGSCPAGSLGLVRDP